MAGVSSSQSEAFGAKSPDHATAPNSITISMAGAPKPSTEVEMSEWGTTTGATAAAAQRGGATLGADGVQNLLIAQGAELSDSGRTQL